MTIITKLFYSVFTFTGSLLFVEYGDPTTPSWSYWILPGELDE